MQTFCALKTKPKLPFFQVSRQRQSPQIMRIMINYDIVLTFGWFGGAFLMTSTQKLAILADQILTFYKEGIIGLAKRGPSEIT